MSSAPVTAIYAGLLALWFIFLSYRVVMLRRGARIGIGTGEDRELAKRVRVHGNAAEYVPFGLLLMLLLELNTAVVWLLHTAGVALVLGRVFHFLGLGRTAGTSWGRFSGTAVTWAAILVLGGANLGYGLFRVL